MKTMAIKLKTVEDVKTFVSIANQFMYHIDLIQGASVLDGKSIMGIFSLDLDIPIICQTPEEDSDDLFEAIAIFTDESVSV